MNYSGFKEVTLIVCGGRNFNDFKTLSSVLDDIHKRRGIACIIHGAAKGADSLAGEWAVSNKVQEKPVPANWKEHGKRAGFIRNWQMIQMRPDGVLAFPGGKGTADMVRIARKNQVPVKEI